jgi:hypothetical protein
MSAPPLSNAFTMARWPFQQAQCKEVLPLFPHQCLLHAPATLGKLASGPLCWPCIEACCRRIHSWRSRQLQLSKAVKPVLDLSSIHSFSVNPTISCSSSSGGEAVAVIIAMLLLFLVFF